MESRAQLRRDPRACRVHPVHGNARIRANRLAQRRTLPDDLCSAERSYTARYRPRPLTEGALPGSFLCRAAACCAPTFAISIRQEGVMTAPDLSMAQISRRMLSAKAEQFTESVIREMTRLALKHNAVNLSQGFPDFPAPAEIKEAARQAIADDINQYAITWGAKPLRDAVVEKFARTQGVKVDPEREITICCGSTEAMMSSMMAIINPGDEIVVLEPFYENYGPDAILSGATPRFVKLRPPDWSFDEKELAAAFGPRTKAIILNTPNNPTGKVFARAELEFIRDLCVRWNSFCITDEIYEHILYDGAEHVSMARIEGMRDRTITVNGMSKTYSVTGWRVGWAIAPPEATSAIRKVHDFLTVGAAAPLQQAGAMALRLPQSYYDKLANDYLIRRNRMLEILEQAGFRCF